jgi:hypothetical protein
VPDLPMLVQQAAIGGGAAVITMLIWLIFVSRIFASSHHRKIMENLDLLTPLPTQTRKDSWMAVKKMVHTWLEDTAGQFSLKQVKQEYSDAREVFEKGSGEIRDALAELSNMKPEGPEVKVSYFPERSLSLLPFQVETDMFDVLGRNPHLSVNSSIFRLPPVILLNA